MKNNFLFRKYFFNIYIFFIIKFFIIDNDFIKIENEIN